MNSARGWLLIYAKGLAIGVAELIPGISGGTVALITGIYARLVTAIGHFDFTWLGILRKLPSPQAFRQAANHVDLYFLGVLGLGMVTTVVLGADLVHWLLEEHKQLLWGFFFGLMLGALRLLMDQTGAWRHRYLVVIVLGVLASLIVTRIQLYEAQPAFWFIILSGAIAGCVWILPGVSGSFMLLVLGMYSHLIDAIVYSNLKFLLLFGLGLGLGLPAFSRLLSRLLTHYKSVTLWFLISFTASSIHQLWPWQQVVSYYYDEVRGNIPLETRPILPGTWQNLHAEDPMLVAVIALMVAGVVVVFLIERRWQQKLI